MRRRGPGRNKVMSVLVPLPVAYVSLHAQIFKIAVYDTKAGDAEITYAWELGDQETLFGKIIYYSGILPVPRASCSRFHAR
jgi:hypothetical protein